MSEWNPKANAIFSQAIELHASDEVKNFLDQACSKQPELRQQVERLLRAHVDPQSLADRILPELTPTVVSVEDTAAKLPEEPSLDFLDPCAEGELLGTISKYQVLELLGWGGMGVVLRALDPKLNRIVALKVLSPELAANPLSRKRFLREAQAAAAVRDDHVVTIHAVEDEGKLPLLVMECIEGITLQEKIEEKGPLELPEILRIATQTASGLAAAHNQGLVHRDVKPGNILLENGVQRVKITDFGLARAVDDCQITQPGLVAGTPTFMSPEQARGEAVDHRSDLFSLGSVIYAMCVGRSPFRAESVMGTMRRVCEDTPRPIGEINPDIPSWLVDIVNNLLKKNPNDRIQSASELAQLLGQCLAHIQNPTVHPLPEISALDGRFDVTPAVSRPTPTRRRWSMVGAVVLAVAALFGVSETSGVTHLTATVVRLAWGEGALVIEIDDPDVSIAIDGEEVSISAPGVLELRLRPGRHQLDISKDGQSVRRELVEVTRGGKRVVRVSQEVTPSVPPRPSDELQVLLLRASKEVFDGRSDEATATYELALEIAERTQQREYAIEIHHRLARLYCSIGEFRLGFVHWQQAIDANLPTRSEFTPAKNHAWASVDARDVGAYELGNRLEAKGVAFAERDAGKGSFEANYRASFLANSLVMTGDYTEAYKRYKQLQPMLEQVLVGERVIKGPDAGFVSLAQSEWLHAKYENDPQRRLEYLEAAERYVQKSTYPGVSEWMEARIMTDLGKSDEAARLMRKSRERLASLPHNAGNIYWMRRFALRDHVDLLRRLNRPSEIEDVLEKAIKLRNEECPSHPDLAYVLQMYGDFLQEQGNVAEAREQFRKAHDILEAAEIVPRNKRLAVVERLLELARQLADDEQVGLWQQKRDELASLPDQPILMID